MSFFKGLFTKNPYPKYVHTYLPPSEKTFPELLSQCHTKYLNRKFEQQYKDKVVEWRLYITNIDTKNKSLKLLANPTVEIISGSEIDLALKRTSPDKYTVKTEETFKAKLMFRGGALGNLKLVEAEEEAIPDRTFTYEKYLNLFSQAADDGEAYFEKYWKNAELKVEGICQNFENLDTRFWDELEEFRAKMEAYEKSLIEYGRRQAKGLDAEKPASLEVPKKPENAAVFHLAIPEDSTLTCLVEVPRELSHEIEQLEKLANLGNTTIVGRLFACDLKSSTFAFVLRSWSSPSVPRIPRHSHNRGRTDKSASGSRSRSRSVEGDKKKRKD